MKILTSATTTLLLSVAFFAGAGIGRCPAADTHGRQNVRDMAGRNVMVPAHITRVATNGGVVDEWILMLGGQSKLVATSVSNQHNPWFIKLFPQIRRIPAVFSPSGDVNVEALIKSNPDVVMMLSGLTTQYTVQTSGIPVIVLERRNAYELKRSIMLSGHLLGRQEQAVAEHFCSYYDSAVKRVQRRTAALPAQKRVRVYYASGPNPLETDGRQTMAADWIAQAGGINVAAQAGIAGMNRTISLEGLLLWNPDVIITSTRVAAERIMNSRQWVAISAVRNHRVYVNPTGLYLWSRNSSETALQTLWSAKMIHPELFTDLDMNRETRNFYQTFFHYRLSDPELQSILFPKQ
jgi:iron complex transport system substrate-binding protein